MGFLGDMFKGSGGGIISSAIGAFSQWRTNEANKALHESDNAYNAEQAQLNRDFQASQAQNQMDFEERMYQQYQSPQALVDQYQEAGLNPALMMTSGSHGAAGSFNGAAGGGSQASSASPIAMQSPLDALTLAQARNLNVDSDKKEEETEGVKIENAHKDKLLLSQIHSNEASAEEKAASAAYYCLQGEQLEKVMPYVQRLSELDVELKEKKSSLTDVEIEKGQEEIKKISEEVKKIISDTVLNDAREGLINAEKAQALASARLLSEQAISELIKRDLMDTEFNLNVSKQKEIDAVIRNYAYQDTLLDEKALTEAATRLPQVYNLVSGSASESVKFGPFSRSISQPSHFDFDAWRYEQQYGTKPRLMF